MSIRTRRGETGPHRRRFKVKIPSGRIIEVPIRLDHPLARKSAKQMLEAYGPPDDTTRNSMIWYNLESRGIKWKKIELKNEAIPHGFPADHVDFLYSTADIDIPDEVHKEMSGTERFSSAKYDPLKKEVTVRCAFMTKNELTFKKIVEAVERHKSLEKKLKSLDKAQADAPPVNK